MVPCCPVTGVRFHSIFCLSTHYVDRFSAPFLFLLWECSMNKEYRYSLAWICLLQAKQWQQGTKVFETIRSTVLCYGHMWLCSVKKTALWKRFENWRHLEANVWARWVTYPRNLSNVDVKFTPMPLVHKTVLRHIAIWMRLGFTK